MKFSIVIPVMNEEGSVEELHREVVKVMKKMDGDFEIIFVDDGSRDGTLEKLRKLKPVKIVEFRRNYGQTAALDAGFKQAVGDFVVTLDGDLQNDPRDIPKLYKKIKSGGGYDVVSGWRHERRDPLGKRVASRGANYLRKFFADDGIQDSGCTLKIYRREAIEDLDLYGEMHRFIPAILKWRGFRVTEEKVRHHERKSGKTKYNWKRIVKGLVDMFSVWFWRKYANRPLHLFGGFGFLFVFSGMALGAVLVVLRVVGRISLGERIWPLIAVFLVLVGVQLFVSGLLADIAIKTYYKREPSYRIRKVTER